MNDLAKFRKLILNVATSLIGTVEATGKNDGPIIERIQASTGNKKGDAYCVSFNYYCYLKANFGWLVPKSAWSPDWGKTPTWTRENGGLTPLAGDTFCIFSKKLGRIAHGGIIEVWNDKNIITIEGNTSYDAEVGSEQEREGEGFYRKKRQLEEIYSVTNWFEVYGKIKAYEERV